MNTERKGPALGSSQWHDESFAFAPSGVALVETTVVPVAATKARFEAWLYYANPTDLQDTPRAQVDATPVLWFMHFTKDCFTISDRKKAHAGSSPLCEGAGAEAQVLGASRL